MANKRIEKKMARKDVSASNVKQYSKPPKLIHGIDISDTNELSMSNMGRDFTGLMLTPNKLFAIWDNAANGDPSDQVALFNSILDRDGYIASLVATRIKSVKNKKWSVVGSNEAKREQIEKVLKGAKDVYASATGEENDGDNLWTTGGNLIGFSFDKMLSYLMLKPFFGYSGVKVDFGAGGEYINTFMPVAPENWRFTDNWGVYIQPAGGSTIYINGNKRYEYVMHMGSSDGRYGIPPTTGLCRPISYMYFRKSYAEMHQSRLLEKFGIPWVVSKLAPTDFNNPDTRMNIEKQLKNLAGDGAAVVTKDSELKLEGLGAASNSGVFLEAIKEIKESLAIAILGQQASVQQTGGFSNGQIQENVRNDITASDCKEIEDTITGLINTIEMNTWGTTECSFKIDYEGLADVEKLGKISDLANKSGLEVDEDYMRKAFSVPVNKKKETATSNTISNILGGGNAQGGSMGLPTSGTENPIESALSSSTPAPETTNATVAPVADINANPESALASLGTAALNDTIKKTKLMAFADINEAIVVNNYIKQLISNSEINDILKQRVINNLPIDPDKAIDYVNNRLANAVIAEETNDDSVNKLRMQIAVLSPADIYNKVKEQIPMPSIDVNNKYNIVPMADTPTQEEVNSMINGGNIAPISGEQVKPEPVLIQPDKPSASFTPISTANTATVERGLQAVIGKINRVSISELVNKYNAIKEQFNAISDISQISELNLLKTQENIIDKETLLKDKTAEAFDRNFEHIRNIIQSLVAYHFRGEHKDVSVNDVVAEFLGKEFFSSIPKVTIAMQSYYNDLAKQYAETKPMRDVVKQIVDNPESRQSLRTILANMLKTQEQVNAVRDEFSYQYNRLTDDKRKQNDKYNSDFTNFLNKTDQQIVASLNDSTYAAYNFFNGHYQDADNALNLNDSAYMFVVNNAKEVMNEEDYMHYSVLTNPTSREMYVNKYVPQIVKAYQFEIYPFKSKDNIKFTHKDYQEYSEFLKNTKNVADKFTMFMKRIDQLRTIDDTSRNNSYNIRSDSFIGDTYYKTVGIIVPMLYAQATSMGVSAASLAMFTARENEGLMSDMIAGGMDKDRARWISGIMAVPISYIDKMQLDKYLGVKEELSKLITTEIKKTIVNLTNHYGMVWLYETSTEAVQTVMEELTKKFSENPDYKYGDWKDLLQSVIEQSIEAAKSMVGSTLFFSMPTVLGSAKQIKNFREKIKINLESIAKRMESVNNIEGNIANNLSNKTLANINSELEQSDKLNPKDIGVDSVNVILSKEQIDKVNEYLSNRKKAMSEFVPVFEDILKRFNTSGLSVYNAEQRFNIASKIGGLGKVGIGLKNSTIRALGFTDKNITDDGIGMASDIIDKIILLGKDDVVTDKYGNVLYLKPINESDYTKNDNGELLDEDGKTVNIIRNGNNVYAISKDGLPMLKIEGKFTPWMMEGTYSKATGNIYFNTFLADTKAKIDILKKKSQEELGLSDEQMKDLVQEETMNAFIKRVITHEITHRGLSGLDTKTMNNMLLYVWDNVISKDEEMKQKLADRFVSVSKAYGYATKEVTDENGNKKIVADMDSIEKNNAAKIALAEEFVTIKSEANENFRESGSGKKLALKFKAIIRKAFPSFKMNENEVWDIIYNARMNTTEEMLSRNYRSNLEDETLQEENVAEKDDTTPNKEQEKNRNKELFPDKTTFNKLDKDAEISNYYEKDGIGFAEYTNTENKSTDIYISAFGDHDYIAYIRVYENGKPTNKFTSKLERRDSSKIGATKLMVSELQKLLPLNHQYMEDVSVSTDGIRFFINQLKHGYVVQDDENGKKLTTRVGISGESIENDLGIFVPAGGTFDNISVTSNKDFNKVKEAVVPLLKELGLTEKNIYWTNGTVEIDIPVLLRKSEESALRYSISEDVGTDMIDYGAVSRLKKTNDFNRAGYILSDGSMLDLNRADKNTINKLDHRFVSIDGSNIGMQQFIAQGNIRYSPETNSFHIIKEPTSEQYNTMNKIINESVNPPTIEIDSLNKNIKNDKNGKYYDFTQLFGKKYDIMDEADTVIKDIEDIFWGRKKYISPLKFSIAGDINSANFKKWFGDWKNNPEQASRVVDKDGKPLVVYHGTGQEFNTFRISDKMYPSDMASFFTENKKIAEFFADVSGSDIVMPVYLKIKKIANLGNINDEITVKELFNRIGIENVSIPTKIENLKKPIWRWYNDDKYVLNTIKKSGFDGFTGIEKGSKMFGVFEPTQIKSAIGNIGTYDVTNPDIRFSISEKSPVSLYHKAVKNWAFYNIPIINDLVSLGYSKIYFPKNNYKDAKGYFVGNKDNDSIDDIANSIAERRGVSTDDVAIEGIKDELIGLSQMSYKDIVEAYKFENYSEEQKYERMAKEQGIDLTKSIIEEENLPFDDIVDKNTIQFRIKPTEKMQELNRRIYELNNTMNRYIDNIDTSTNAVSSNGNTYNASVGLDWIKGDNATRIKIIEDDYNRAIDNAISELEKQDIVYDYNSAFNNVKSRLLTMISGTNLNISEKSIDDGAGRIYTLTDKNNSDNAYTIGISNTDTNSDYDITYIDNIELKNIAEIIKSIKLDILDNIDFLNTHSESDFNAKKAMVLNIISKNSELSKEARDVIVESLTRSVDSLEEKKKKQEIVRDIPIIKIKQTFNQFLLSIGEAYRAGEKNVITERRTADEYKLNAMDYVDSIVRFERVANAIKAKISNVVFRDVDSYIASIEKIITDSKDSFDSSMSVEKNIENAKEYIRSIYSDDYKNTDILNEYINRLDNIYKNFTLNGGRIDDAINEIIYNAEKYDTFDMSQKEKEKTNTIQRIVLFPQFKAGAKIGSKEAMSMIEDGIKSAIMIIKSSGASIKIRGKLLDIIAKIASNKYGGDVVKQMDMMQDIQNRLDIYIESENKIAELNRLYKIGAKIKGLIYKVSPDYFDMLDSIVEFSVPASKKDLKNISSTSNQTISNKAYILTGEQIALINNIFNEELIRIEKDISDEDIRNESKNEILEMQKILASNSSINLKTLNSEDLSKINDIMNKVVSIIKINSDIFDTARQQEMIENRGIFKREVIAKHIMEHTSDFIIGNLISNQLASGIKQSILSVALQNKITKNAISKLEIKKQKFDSEKDTEKIADIDLKIENLNKAIIKSTVSEEDIKNMEIIFSKDIGLWNATDVGYLSAIIKAVSDRYSNSFTEHNKRSMKTLLMISSSLAYIYNDMKINNTSFYESYKNIMDGLGDKDNTNRHILNVKKMSSDSFNTANYSDMRYFIASLQYLANSIESNNNKLMIGNKDSNAFYNILYWVAGNVSTKDMNWNIADMRKKVTYLLENTLGANAKTLSLIASADPLNKFKEVLFDNINSSENNASYIIKRMIRLSNDFLEENGFTPFTKEEQEKMTLSIGMDDLMGRVFGVWENIKRGDLSEKGAKNMMGEIFKYQNKRAEFFDIELKAKDGSKHTISITPAIAMDVYAYMIADSIREDKYKVIKDDNEGVIIYLGDGRPNQHTIADNEMGDNNAPLNKENAERIVSILSTKEKKYVELMLQFISSEASPLLKIAYEDYFNKPFKDESMYWSILRSPMNGKQIDVKKLSELGYDFNIANFTVDKSGRLITRLPNVNAPIILKDFLVKTGDIFRFIANFSGYIDSLNKFNDMISDPKTRLEIEQVPGYGSRLISDIDFYKKRLTGGLQNSTNPSFLSEMLQNMIRVPLVLNVTSIASQAASYPVGTNSNEVDIFSDGTLRQMPKSYALNIYNMFKALSRGLVYDGTFGIKNIIMPDGRKVNKQDLFMEDMTYVYPSLIDRARGGFSNKHINDKISDYDISRQLMGREPERSYWLYPQYMWDRGTMTQIVFDVANYVFKKNGLDFNTELDKRIKNNTVKPIEPQNTRYFEMLKEVGELSWKLYEAQSQGAIPYTASIEAMPIMKVFGLAFRNAWTQMLIMSRNEINEVHNASLLGGKVEMQKWLRLLQRHKQSMVIMGLFMALIKGLFSYDWDKERNMPYYSGYEEKEGEDFLGTSDSLFMQFMKQAGVESIMSKAGMAPYFQSILYSLKTGSDIIGSMFAPQTKKAGSAIKETSAGVEESDWEKVSSGILKIASAMLTLLRGIPMDRANKLYNIMDYHVERLTEKPNMSSSEIESILNEQAKAKEKLINPQSPISIEVKKVDNKSSVSNPDRTKLSLADYNAIRLARILIEEKKAINRLVDSFEQNKKSIEPYLKDEIINVPNEGSVYFVNGSVSNRIDPEKVKQGLIKIARVSPEIADALIKKWSNVRQMSQYVKISDKDNITKNQEV